MKMKYVRWFNWRFNSIGLLAFLLLNLLTVQARGNSERLVAQTAVSATTHHAAKTNRYILQFADQPTVLARQQTHINQLAYQSQLLATQTAVLNSLSIELNRPIEPHFQYTRVFNGVAVSLTENEVTAVLQNSNVQRLYPEEIYELTTDRGPEWIGAPAVWDGSQTPHNIATKGEGIIIGVLDTGINYEHPSFADVGEDGYNHTNPWGKNVYVGVCTNTINICNDKLIGAWDFVDSLGEFDGVSDSNGHGSHTASTAAGNVVTAHVLTQTGYEYTAQISGVAPHANIVSYDICVDGCFRTALLAAVDQAVADGVDVINFSISGGVDPYSDPISQAFLAANQAGIVVSAAAGNDGPSASTINHISPWVMTVGAVTHDRAFANRLIDFSGGAFQLTDLTGQGLTSGYGPAPVVHAADFGDRYCLNPFPPETWNGEIVVCDRGEIARVEKGENVLIGGAGGFILANTSAEGDGLSNDDHALPAVHITFGDAQRLNSWLALGSNHRVVISGTEIASSDGDQMAQFSSRGPTIPFGLIKPDVVAPGVGILAAFHDGEDDFAFSNGTSMAAPHAAGAAALLKSLYPTWTPDEIRSALMMTSITAVSKETGFMPADAYDSGAGRINVANASRAGLVMNETFNNYNEIDAYDLAAFVHLNVPSLTNGACFEQCSWQRTFRNPLDTAVSWQATGTSDDGLLFDVSPASFTVGAGMTQTVTITADVSQFFGPSGWGYGTILLNSAGQEPLHLPVAVKEAPHSPDGGVQQTAVYYAKPNEIITYEITLDNLDSITNTMMLTSTLPTNVSYIPSSATGGLTYDGANRRLTWQGAVGPGDTGYDGAWITPIDYVNLGYLDTPPTDLCTLFADCDEVTAVFDLALDGHSFPFFGETLSELHISSNGYMMGPEGLSGVACTACPQSFPNPSEPNQLIAGLWRDLDMSNGNGQFYGAFMTGILENPNDVVFYANWQDSAQFEDPFSISAHAIAVVMDGQSEPAGRIYLIYEYIFDPDKIVQYGYAIGVENKDGTVGTAVAFSNCQLSPCSPSLSIGSPPIENATYRLDPTVVANENRKTFTYQVRVLGNPGDLISSRVEASSSGAGGELTAVSDTLVSYRNYYPYIGKSE